MKTNTMRSPASMGEQWVPVPVRLINAIYEAPSMKRRAWAVAYLLVWLVAFHRAWKGAPASMGELEAWTLSNSRQRTVKARLDALGALEKWTDRGLEVDRKRTDGNEVQATVSDSCGLEVDQKWTAHAGASLQTTHLQDYKNTPHPPSEGGSAPAADKPVKKRRTALTLEQIAAVEIPAPLAALDGFVPRWMDWMRVRQRGRGKWFEVQQAHAMLAKLAGFHTEGLDVLGGLETAYQSNWQGIERRYLERLAEPAAGALTLLDGSKDAWTGARAWTLMIRSTLDVQSIHTPGIRDHWRMAPDTPGLDLAILATLQEVTETSSVGFAWRDLRTTRRDDWQRRDLERRFVKAFPAHWRRAQQEVAA
jgi:hypothetical protein